MRRVAYGVAFTLAATAAAGIGWVLWQNERGVEAILELCKTRGGLHIEETAHADGYFDLQGAYTCPGCMERLGKRQYSYVDFKYSSPTPLSDQPGYLRMTIAKREDPRCARYDRAVGRGTIPPGQTYGLQTDECFVIDPLDQRPTGFVYGRRFGKTAARNGVTVVFDEIYVADERNNRDLAVSRNYSYFEPLAAWTDMSGGGGVAHTSCDQTAGVPFVTQFVDQVLLKTAGNPPARSQQ